MFSYELLLIFGLEAGVHGLLVVSEKAILGILYGIVLGPVGVCGA